jgi:hypothetical protein
LPLRLRASPWRACEFVRLLSITMARHGLVQPAEIMRSLDFYQKLFKKLAGMNANICQPAGSWIFSLKNIRLIFCEFFTKNNCEIFKKNASFSLLT